MGTIINYCSSETKTFCMNSGDRVNKLLDLSISNFLKNHLSCRKSKNLEKVYLEAFNLILVDLDSYGVISISEEEFVSGIKVINDVYFTGISPILVQNVLKTRKEINPIVNLDDKLSPTIKSMVEDEDNILPFETMVAYKYIRKQYNALTRGISFELTLSDMRRLLKTKRCYYSGVELTVTGVHALSLDRKDVLKGYTKENTVSCSALVNEMKNNLLEQYDAEFRFSDKKALAKMLKSFGDLFVEV